MKGYALFYYENTPNGVVKKYFNSMAFRSFGLGTNITFASVDECIDVHSKFNLKSILPSNTQMMVEGPRGKVYNLKGIV